MTPLLLLLLLLCQFPLATSKEVCNEHATCLYFTTCYYVQSIESDLDAINSTMMMPTVNASMSAEGAVRYKLACAGVAVISTLSILWTSKNSMNVSFETDLNEFGFAFGHKDTAIYLAFDSTNIDGSMDVKGIEVTDKSKSSSIESLGRATYSFRVEAEEQPLMNRDDYSVALLIGNQVFEFPETSFEFLKATLSKLACERETVHDSCHGREDCEEIIFDTHSLSCEQFGQLTVNLKSSSDWADVTSVSCKNGLWGFATVNGTIEVKHSEKIDALCHKPVPNEPSNETSISPSDDEDVEPVPQHADDTATGAPTVAEKKKEKEAEKNSLPGNKWMWIGGGVGLFVVIIIVNVIVCIFCYKRNKNTTTKKQSKVSKKNNKKGGKKSDNSSAQQPSTSESKGGDESKKPLVGSSSNVSSNAPGGEKSDAPTEMNLDLLKTEMIR